MIYYINLIMSNNNDEEWYLRYHLHCNYIDARGYQSIPFTEMELIQINQYIKTERHQQISQLSHETLINLINSALIEQTFITEETLIDLDIYVDIKSLTNHAQCQVYKEMNILRLRELMEYYEKIS